MKQQNFFQNIDLIKSNRSDPQVINLFSLEEIKDILKFYNDLLFLLSMKNRK